MNLVAAGLPPELAEVTTPLTVGMALLIIVLGLPAALAAGRHTGARLAAAIGLAVEFLLAGGLLRLATLDDFMAVGMVAAIVAVRSAIRYGIRFAVRAEDLGDPKHV